MPAAHGIEKSRCDNKQKSQTTWKNHSRADDLRSRTGVTIFVKVRFNTSELDMLVHMMDKANETVKSTFIKQVLFGKPFKVLVTDKSLATYCAKLSEFFAQFRTVGVNYNLIVKELRTEFSEKKAMQYLYRLEKATIEMANILAEVKALTVKFDEVWSQKSL